MVLKSALLVLVELAPRPSEHWTCATVINLFNSHSYTPNSSLPPYSLLFSHWSPAFITYMGLPNRFFRFMASSSPKSKYKIHWFQTAAEAPPQFH